MAELKLVDIYQFRVLEELCENDHKRLHTFCKEAFQEETYTNVIRDMKKIQELLFTVFLSVFLAVISVCIMIELYLKNYIVNNKHCFSKTP